MSCRRVYVRVCMCLRLRIFGKEVGDVEGFWDFVLIDIYRRLFFDGSIGVETSIFLAVRSIKKYFFY